MATLEALDMYRVPKFVDVLMVGSVEPATECEARQFNQSTLDSTFCGESEQMIRVGDALVLLKQQAVAIVPNRRRSIVLRH